MATRDVIDGIYVAKIVKSTSTDGEGLRNSLYVSGCNIKCKGCHNEQWWHLKSGTKMDFESIFQELNEDDFNISILGGEPIMQYDGVLELCKMIKKRTNKTIWLYSGHTMEDIKAHFPKILHYIDVLVDGPFKEELKDATLPFRGSKNQRIIEVKSILQK